MPMAEFLDDAEDLVPEDARVRLGGVPRRNGMSERQIVTSLAGPARSGRTRYSLATNGPLGVS